MSGGTWILLAKGNVKNADLATRTLTFGESRAEVVLGRDGAETLACLYSACER